MVRAMTDWSVSFSSECLRPLDFYRVSTAKASLPPIHVIAATSATASNPACRIESKRQAQSRWSAKPENQNYFRGPENVDRVRQWRSAHPGYWKRAQIEPPVALQDLNKRQQVAPQPVPRDLFATALQDISRVQTPLLVGLISQTLGSTLQDDIARHIHGLVAKGQDLMDSPSRKTMQRNRKKAEKPQQKRLGASS